MSSSSSSASSSSNPPSSDPLLLPRLAHALSLISTTNPRTIPSPSTQPRRASVALLIRIRPSSKDQDRLAQCYDSEGMPIKDSEVDVDFTNSSSNETSEGGVGGVDQRQDGTVVGSGIGEEEVETIKRQEIERKVLGERIGMEESQASILKDESLVDVSKIQDSEASLIDVPVNKDQITVGQDQIPADSKVPKSKPSPISTSSTPSSPSTPYTQFFSQPWVQNGIPELLFIKRSSRPGDSWSSHVAFPGGRREESDENGLYTAMRETWEEVGIDLAENCFLPVGALDDREITTSLGKRLLMVLSPYVFLQTTPFSPLPDLQPSEVASAHWIPISLLFTSSPRWGTTSVDIASRLAPKSPAVRWTLRALVGKMDFRCVLLPNEPVAIAEDEDEEFDSNGEKIVKEEHYPLGERPKSPAIGAKPGDRPELRLWGLTLGMTLDLLSHMTTYPDPSSPFNPSQSQSYFTSTHSSGSNHQLQPQTPSTSQSLPTPHSTSNPYSNLSVVQLLPHLKDQPILISRQILSLIRDELHLNPPPHASAKAPSMTSVFPRFSYPDVNFWIWVFGWRYRAVVRSWERGVGTRMERRVNWAGLALGAFYSAVRRALIVAIALRAMGALSIVGLGGWLIKRKQGRRRRGEEGFGLDELIGN